MTRPGEDFSMNREPSPNPLAYSGSVRRLPTSHQRLQTVRIPRPPPPAPFQHDRIANLSAIAPGFLGIAKSSGCPEMIGMPSEPANSRAWVLSPKKRQRSARPMKAMPSSSIASAKALFSDRKRSQTHAVERTGLGSLDHRFEVEIGAHGIARRRPATCRSRGTSQATRLPERTRSVVTRSMKRERFSRAYTLTTSTPSADGGARDADSDFTSIDALSLQYSRHD